MSAGTVTSVPEKKGKDDEMAHQGQRNAPRSVIRQAWSVDAPKKRSDAFANTLKVLGGRERGYDVPQEKNTKKVDR